MFQERRLDYGANDGIEAGRIAAPVQIPMQRISVIAP
jgi:hypothetical protein